MSYNPIGQGSPKQALKAAQIIHGALIAGLLMFAATSFFVAPKPAYLDFGNSNHDPLFYMVLILAVVCLNVGTIIFRQQITRFNNEAIQKQATLSDKMKAYQTALIVRYALLEGPALFGIVAFLLSANLYFLIISGLLIIFMLMLRPTPSAAENYLQLSYEEAQQLQ